MKKKKKMVNTVKILKMNFKLIIVLIIHVFYRKIIIICLLIDKKLLIYTVVIKTLFINFFIRNKNLYFPKAIFHSNKFKKNRKI
jgi:hypothetical protein